MQNDPLKQVHSEMVENTKLNQKNKELQRNQQDFHGQTAKPKMATIMIPTYNRPDRLKRLLSYFNSCGIHGKIIIADSSTSENKRKNREIVSFFPEMEILYLDYFASDVIGWIKWGEAINRSDSKYTVICADDDFIAPKAIDEAVSFLEKNPDFAVVYGPCISFEVNKKTGEEKQFLWRPIYPYKTIDSPDPKERVLSHFANYYPTIFSVHRTHLLKIMFEQTIKYSLENGYLGEIFCSMISLIYGKSKNIDAFYSARETISDSYSRVFKGIDYLMAEGSYNEKYNKFKQGLVLHLSREAKISNEEAGKIIDKGMNIYLKKSYLNFGVKIKNTLRKTKLPFGLSQTIRSIYLKALNYGQPEGYLDDLANSEDFKKIRETIMASLGDK